MEFLANIFANIAIGAAAEGSSKCIWFTFDEPECPTEIL